MQKTTKTSEETQKVGEEFGQKLRGGEIVALVGELGSGKTTFVQGLARGLKINQRVNSPTFIIMRSYAMDGKSFFHVDLYRLEGNLENEIKNLGLEELWGKKENIVVIEWAEKIKDLIPQNAVWIELKINEKGEHEVIY